MPSSGCSDDDLVITLAMVCPFEPAEKQALLEAGTIPDQAAMLLTLLRMGSIGPDAQGGRALSVERGGALNDAGAAMSEDATKTAEPRRRSIRGCWRSWSAR